MKFYYQKELDNLDIETVKAIEEYTEETTSNYFLNTRGDEFDSLRDESDKVTFLEELGDELNLEEYKLTDIQQIIIAYMFINDLFTKTYTDGVMELLDKTLL